MKKLLRLLIMGITAIIMVGCASTQKVKYEVLESSSVDIEQKEDIAFKLIASSLVEQGFDLKMSDKDIGLITTEWKQIDNEYIRKYQAILQSQQDLMKAMGGNSLSAKFDYYMQLKFKISSSENKLRIKILPMLKSVNRLNATAFSESPLTYDNKANEYLLKVKNFSAQEAIYQGSKVYYDQVIEKLSELLGVSPSDFVNTVSTENYSYGDQSEPKPSN